MTHYYNDIYKLNVLVSTPNFSFSYRALDAIQIIPDFSNPNGIRFAKCKGTNKMQNCNAILRLFFKFCLKHKADTRAYVYIYNTLSDIIYSDEIYETSSGFVTARNVNCGRIL